MTTEHVSVPRTVEDVRNWHLHQLRTLKEAWQPYEHHKACAAILSRATPSDGSAELNYAKSLATSMWEKHYAKDAPQWESCDDLYGVLSQIDNMLTGLQRGKPSAPRVVTAELSNTIAGDIAEHLRDKGWSSGGDYQDDFLPDVEIATRAALESFATSLPAAVPDGIADALLDAWRSIAHVSGSALLSGEKKAQTSEQRELVYGMACNALITIGNAYYELTGKNPDFDTAPQAGETK